MNHVMYLQVLFTGENGHFQKTFYPFCGVNEELKAFVHDISEASKVLYLVLISSSDFVLLLTSQLFIEISCSIISLLGNQNMI